MEPTENNFEQPVEQAAQPATSTYQMTYARFWARYAAAFIDGIILFAVSFIIGFVFGFVAEAAGLEGEIGEILSTIISIIVGWIYFIYLTHTKQATIGKKALHLKVVDESGTRLTLGKIILRETIGKIISAIIIYVGYIMAAFTEKKQGLHDIMAKSVVVSDPNNPPSKGLIITSIVLTVVVPVLIIGVLSTVVLSSLNEAREKAQQSQATTTPDFENSPL